MRCFVTPYPEMPPQELAFCVREEALGVSVRGMENLNVGRELGLENGGIWRDRDRNLVPGLGPG